MTYETIIDDIFSERKKRVILDTDAFNEMDDQYAIAYSLGSDRIKLEAITAVPFNNNRSESFGDGMEKSYNEILRIMEVCGRTGECDVLKGSTEKFDGKGQDTPAARRMIEAAHDKSEPLYILAVGCLSNVASALALDPTIKDNVFLVWLGGMCIEESGRLAEFNMIQDYAAAQYVMNSGVKMIMLPTEGGGKNGTADLETDKAGFSGITGDRPAAVFFRETFPRTYTKGKFDEPGWTRIVWDISAPGLLSVPDAYTVRTIPAPIFTDDRHYSFRDDRHLILYMEKIDAKAVFADAFGTISKI